MSYLLDAIFCGAIYPIPERQSQEENCLETAERIVEEMNYWKGRLSEPDYIRIMCLRELFCDMHDIASCEMFQQGVAFATQFMVKVIAQDKENEMKNTEKCTN